jgi:signal transduction histidine kinase
VRLRSPGLRLRVALALALACLLVVGTLGAALYAASEQLEASLIEQIIDDEMDFLLRRSRQEPAFSPQPGGKLNGYIVRADQDADRVPAHLRALNPGRHEVLLGGEEVNVLVRDADGVRYYVAYEVGLHEQREQEFKMLVMLFVLVAALVSLLLGFSLSGVLVSQVVGLARQVGELKPGEGRQALARPGLDPEVALLARAFDDYRARIGAMMRREQEFTANASHELRTPLTAIKTSCELLLADPAITDKARARVARVSEAAERMAEQIQALLLLARGQSLGEVERVTLADCVAEAAEPYRAEMARKGLAFQVEVAPDAALDLNYQALRFVLGNLIRNAVHYTAGGFIRVAHADGGLSVSDSGRGMSAEVLPRVFERFFRGEQTDGGMGLGLSIVKRVCDLYGWRITVESAPGKGSTFSILFS